MREEFLMDKIDFTKPIDLARAGDLDKDVRYLYTLKNDHAVSPNILIASDIDCEEFFMCVDDYGRLTPDCDPYIRNVKEKHKVLLAVYKSPSSVGLDGYWSESTFNWDEDTIKKIESRSNLVSYQIVEMEL